MNVQVLEATRDEMMVVLSKSPVSIIPNADKLLSVCYEMSSSAWIGVVDDEAVCAWGLIPPTLLSDRAYIWLMTTEAMENYKLVFIRQSQIWMKKMLERYSDIYGHAAVGNDKGIRWLKWLGAEFDAPIGERIPFHIRGR